MKARGISNKSTIYNFSLIKKISYSHRYILIYCIICFSFVILAIIFLHVKGMLVLLFGTALTQALHYIIVRLLLTMEATADAVQGPWKIRWHYPCIGYLPTNFISTKSFLTIHLHLLLIGTACISLLYTWVPAIFFYLFLFIHFWVLLPRFIVLWYFKRLPKPGLIKLNNQDASYYTP